MSHVLEIKVNELHQNFVREDFLKLLPTLIEGSWPHQSVPGLATTLLPPLSAPHFNLNSQTKNNRYHVINIDKPKSKVRVPKESHDLGCL